MPRFGSTSSTSGSAELTPGSGDAGAAAAELRPVLVGRLGRAHGLRGAISVDVRTDSPDERFEPGSVLVRGTAGAADGPELVVADAWWHSGRLLVVFDGYADRTAVEGLRGSFVYALVDPAEVPAEEGEYYDHQLVGLAAQTEAGEPLGVVSEVLHLPGQDLLAIAAPGAPEVLVPFVAELVPVVDVAGGRVVIVPPPGLFDPNDEVAEAQGPDGAGA